MSTNDLYSELSLVVALKYGNMELTDAFADNLPDDVCKKIFRGFLYYEFPDRHPQTVLKQLFGHVRRDKPEVQDSYKQRIEEIIFLHEIDKISLL